MESVYLHNKIEEQWYKHWLENRSFHSEISSKKPFCIVIPPPNITGSLHMGHALDNTIQDLLIRWNRMKGYNAMWLPGTDHAGIATQMVVEKALSKEGISRYTLGRDAFLERVWEWKKQYGGIIVEQLKKLGCSCDWDRERFTMDESYTKAVRKAFVSLYNKGFIYRDYYIINWCPRCQTAISDLEVEHEEDLSGKLYYVLYPFPGEDAASGNGIVIATTRPETILADVAIAVNPKDERYIDLIGKKVIVPVANRLIPIIPDEVVDPQFGTGALKITPGHDLNDFQAGRRHKLETFVVIDSRGKMNKEAENLSQGHIPTGTDRFLARRIMEDLLKEGKCLVKEPETYALPLARCARCTTVLEPTYSLQWFMRMGELAAPAIEVVKNGTVKFVPERFTGIYLNWMENIRDWCLSRQLWWGHRIPAWYCNGCGGPVSSNFTPIISEEPPAKCPSCGSNELTQDNDVLDTWFSSALWPFATMGWPEKTKDLDYFYPTSVLVTGRDILFLWVARMIMMGLEFIGKIPFSDLYIHATILDKDGRRMSKSKGTGVDPLDLISKYGADATRFGILFQTAQGQDVRFSHEKIEMARNFGNKIWNAARLILKYVDSPPPEPEVSFKEWLLPDQWIYLKTCEVTSKLSNDMAQYAFSDAARTLYEFFWSDFCDWYLEIAKLVFSSENEERKSIVKLILWDTLSKFIRLLHPMMPFLTEEIWHIMHESADTIMTAPYPKPEEFKSQTGENISDLGGVVNTKMLFLMDIVRAIRNMRAELNIPPKQEVPIAFICHKEDDRLEKEILTQYALEISVLGKVSSLYINDGVKKAVTAHVRNSSLFLPLEGLVDLDLEKERLRKELNNISALLDSITKKLTPEFKCKAKSEVVSREEKRQEDLQAKRHMILNRLELLK